MQSKHIKKPQGAKGLGKSESIPLVLKEKVLTSSRFPDYPHWQAKDFINLSPDEKNRIAGLAAPLLMEYGKRFAEFKPYVKAAINANIKNSKNAGKIQEKMNKKFHDIRIEIGDRDEKFFGVAYSIIHFVNNSFSKMSEDAFRPVLILETIEKSANDHEYATKLSLAMFSNISVNGLMADIGKLQG